MAIKTDVEKLRARDDSIILVQQETTIRSLEAALVALRTANTTASPAVSSRVVSASEAIEQLKLDVGQLSHKQHYEKTLTNIRQLEQSLLD